MTRAALFLLAIVASQSAAGAERAAEDSDDKEAGRSESEDKAFRRFEGKDGEALMKEEARMLPQLRSVKSVAQPMFFGDKDCENLLPSYEIDPHTGLPTLTYLSMPCPTVPDTPEVQLAMLLGKHPAVADELRWYVPGVGWTAYVDWPLEFKDALLTSMVGAIEGTPSGVVEIPPIIEGVWGISFENAQAIYLAHVGHSLAVELTGRVPWSLTDYNAEQLHEILDPQAMLPSGPQCGMTKVTPSEALECEQLVMGFSGDGVTAMPPQDTWAFLQEEGLIGATRVDTIGLLSDWTRAHLLHSFSNIPQGIGLRQYFWGYDGPPLVKAMIEGVVLFDKPYQGLTHWSRHCGGTTSFLQSVLRVANLPVKKKHFGHRLPHFMYVDLYASHGDDFYSLLVKTDPPVPTSYLDYLIDQEQYEAWFQTEGVSPNDFIGMKPCMVALHQPPRRFLYEWCRHRDDGDPARIERVYASLARCSTEAELDAYYWDLLGSVADSVGGCPDDVMDWY
jgi:hypothetical protein